MSLPLALLNELMGIVPNASEHGPSVDHFLEVLNWFMLVLFLGWGTYFLYVIFRFHRSRNPRADYHGVKSKASAHLEFVVVLIEAVLLLGFGLPLWGKRVNEFPDKDNALRVRVIGQQFAWNFHYAGPDGVFGEVDAKYVSPSNPMGINPNDPAGKDDYLSPTNIMNLENYRPTMLEVSSKDVIHSFSLHAMRVDQDAMPGSKIPLWFRPTKAGDYEVVCAQLCGANHFSMKALATVMPPSEFKEWEAGKLKANASAAPAGATAGAPVVAPPGTTAAPVTTSPGVPGNQAPAQNAAVPQQVPTSERK